MTILRSVQTGHIAFSKKLDKSEIALEKIFFAC